MGATMTRSHSFRSACLRLGTGLTILLFASLAFARPPGGPPPGGGPGEGGHGGGRAGRGGPPLVRTAEKHAARLGLDAEVVEQIHGISQTGHAERQALHGQLRSMHDELRSMLETDEPDEARILEQAERIGALDVALHKSRLRSMLQVRKLLTPEQLRELVKIHEETRLERPRHRRGKYRPDSPPEQE